MTTLSHTIIHHLLIPPRLKMLLDRLSSPLPFSRACLRRLLRNKRLFPPLDLVQLLLEDFARDGAVARLAARLLAADCDAARDVAEDDAAGCLVDLLAAGAAPFDKGFLEVALVERGRVVLCV